MKITVLSENTAFSPRFIAEHGLSLYIETEKEKILFDMGQSNAFIKNAETLEIDLGEVDFAVLSHGHYDHGGGLEAFLSVNRTAPVYLSRHAFGDYFSSKYIGLNKALKDNPRLHFIGDYCRIRENAELYSCNDALLPYPSEPFGLTAEYDGKRTDDDFRHEQYLLIEEKGKRILVSGCSHKGILNLVQHFKPDVVIGGFHFMKLDASSSEDRTKLFNAAEKLSAGNIVYYTCHCTGEEQYNCLKETMNNLHYISCGMVQNI